jgi:uncharacterized protein
MAESFRAKLDPNAPQKKLLALDGGGIRGMIAVEVLARIESVLQRRLGRDNTFVLADYFDYIAGTSTGAIIATCLSLGMRVDDIRKFYIDSGPAMFNRAGFLRKLHFKFEDEPLAQKLKEVVGGDTTLGSDKLRTLLMMVLRNASTDSPWPLSNNPNAKYCAADLDDCNLNLPLWQLVRASTAAPVFFPPEVVSWDPNDPAKSFVFVDGGTTAYNNCAFLLFRMATEPAYRLGWQTGEKHLLVVSVGTGSAPVLGDTADDPSTNVVEAALNTLSTLMSQAAVDQDVNCRVIGRCTYGGIIDRELHDLIPIDPQTPDSPLSLDVDTGKAFLYVRYNAELTDAGLAELKLRGLDPRKLRKMDEVDNISDLETVGGALADRVDLAHLGSFVP